jgi:hypothetical protein
MKKKMSSLCKYNYCCQVNYEVFNLRVKKIFMNKIDTLNGKFCILGIVKSCLVKLNFHHEIFFFFRTLDITLDIIIEFGDILLSEIMPIYCRPHGMSVFKIQKMAFGKFIFTIRLS